MTQLPCGSHIIPSELPQRGPNEYSKLLPDGREAVLTRTIFGGRVLVGPPGDMGGDEEFMFDDFSTAVTSFIVWDSYGPPDHWIRWRCKDKLYRKGEDGQPLLSE